MIEQLFYWAGAVTCTLTLQLGGVYAVHLILCTVFKTFRQIRTVSYGAVFYWQGKNNTRMCKKIVRDMVIASSGDASPYVDYELKTVIKEAADKIRENEALERRG